RPGSTGPRACCSSWPSCCPASPTWPTTSTWARSGGSSRPRSCSSLPGRCWSGGCSGSGCSTWPRSRPARGSGPCWTGCWSSTRTGGRSSSTRPPSGPSGGRPPRPSGSRALGCSGLGRGGGGGAAERHVAARHYDLSTTPLRDRGGRLTGRVVVLRDVTDRHQAHERLVRLDEQRRRLLGRVVWAQEEERRRIAGEVHDDAIQTIAAARLMLTTFRDQLTDDAQRRLLDHLEEAVSSSLRRLRTPVFDLRPAPLDGDGLAAALREYLTEMARQGGFVAELRDDLEQEPPAELRGLGYRVRPERRHH